MCKAKVKNKRRLTHVCLSDLLCTLGDSFRGLWTSVILFDSHGGITKKREWSVSYTFQGDYVETPGCNTPEEALRFAIGIIHRA